MQMLAPKDFQKQRNKMLNFYFETEKQFLDLIRIIPLDNKSDTYSPLFYNILQSSCSQVGNMLKLILDKFQLQYEKPNFPEFYNTLDQNRILQRQAVNLVNTLTIYHPFEIEENFDSPFWWRRYNSTKHNLPEGLKEGNILNTVNSLGAIYALHSMAYYAQHATDNFFESSHWMEQDVMLTGDGQLVRNSLDPIPKSELFYAMSRYNESGAGL